MSNSPSHSDLPLLLMALVRRMLRDEHQEEFTGDLEELATARQKTHHPTHAKLLLWVDAISLMRVRFRRKRNVHRSLFPIAMLKNYLFVALRNVKRHAAFSLLNMVGLSVSMAVGLILILFVIQSASQDEFHEKADRIVRVYSDFKSSFNLDNALYGTSPADLSEFMLREVPGIEQAAKIRSGFRGTLTYEGTGFALNGLYADPHFLDMFSFELSSGDPISALKTPGSLLLSQSEATKFFGAQDPIGKVMSASDGRQYTVTGVFADESYNTIFPLSAVASYATLEADSASAASLTRWTNSIYRSYTFALLDEGADLTEVQNRVSALIPVHYAPVDNNELVALNVQPLKDISLGVVMGNELGSSLPAPIAWFMSTLALVILLTASFNYVGLTVSRSLNRSKEVGVRKVFGAGRSHITAQFLIETVVISVLSVIGALVLLQWMVPAFNNFSFVAQSGLNLTIDYSSTQLYVVIVLFTLGVAMIAGVYPALFLSRFQPAEAVKGGSKVSAQGGSKLRKTLVVVQFSMSLIFLIVTVTMVQQARFVQKADYGFTQENIVNVRLFDVPFERFKNRLEGDAAVELVSGISILPAMGSRSDVWISMPGMTDEENVKGYQFAIDENLVEQYGLTLLAGRNVGPDLSFEANQSVLVNERVLSVLQLGSAAEALGQEFIMGDSTRVHIVGVLKDFHADTYSSEIAPNIFMYDVNRLGWANVKMAQNASTDAAYAAILAAWSDMGHTRQAEYELFSSQLENNFSNSMMRDLYRLIGFIATLAVIIACLGLMGIASFNVQRRTKEISIRKVLGAEVSSILGLLSREFLVLIVVSTVVSLPIAYILSTMWLNTFAYRIDFGLGMLVLGLGFIVAIALLTIGSQSLRAALVNPIDNLHDE